MITLLNTSLRNKVRFLMSLLFIVVVISSSSLIINFNNLIGLADHIEHQDAVTLHHAAELKLRVVQVQQWLTDISATRGQDGLNDGFDEAEKNANRFYELIDELKQLDTENASGYEQMLASFHKYYDVGKKMAQIYVDEGPSGGNKMMAQFDEVAADIAAQVDEFSQAAWQRTVDALVKQRQMSESAMTQIWISAATVIFFLILFYFIMSRALADLPAIVDQLKRLSAGDLMAVNEIGRQDEIGEISMSLNAMRNSLVDMISQILDMASKLSNASDNMSYIMGETNNNVQHQRTETEQVAAAMNQMTAAVHEVANNINHAAAAAQEATNETRSGQQVVSQTVSNIQALANSIEKAAVTIQKLEQNSQKITAVLDVIKGVAEQTNLLALNAAIEAARAGEQGRGFAVVADEVRTLASRTQKSTEEINQMIAELQSGTREAVSVMDTSRDNARVVVEQASTANSSLSNIAKAVNRIHEMSSQIASSSEEQGSVSEEINQNIVKISDMTENTADSASKIASSSEELAKLAADLKVVCQRFRLA